MPKMQVEVTTAASAVQFFFDPNDQVLLSRSGGIWKGGKIRDCAGKLSFTLQINDLVGTDWALQVKQDSESVYKKGDQTTDRDPFVFSDSLTCSTKSLKLLRQQPKKNTMKTKTKTAKKKRTKT